MAWTLFSVPLPPKYNYKPWKQSKSQPRQNSERWKAEEGGGRYMVRDPRTEGTTEQHGALGSPPKSRRRPRPGIS